MSPISVIVVTYNHEQYIADCLESVISQDSPEIVVVDNGSIDGTVKIIKSSFPQVKLIKNNHNLGFGAANNQGVENAHGEYLIFLNPDAKMKENSINELIRPIIEDQNLVTTPKVLFYDGQKINTCGNKQHITGMAFTRGVGERPDERDREVFVNGISGACFAMTRENFLKLGGFDETLFLYMEDTELSWRINSQGLKILYVPGAIVYHEYDFDVTPEKIYHVERGRYIILRKYLTNEYYMLLLPSLLMTEILTWGYATLNGPPGIRNKFRAIKDGLTVDVTKENTNHKELVQKMDIMIPKLEFRFNGIFLAFRKVANFTYKGNCRLIR